MVGAQVPITPPVRGAAAGAAGGSVRNVREGRGQPAIVAGVEVPAVSEGPPAVPLGAVRPLVVPAADSRCQQVIPDEILIQLHILILPVAAHLAVIGLGDETRGRIDPAEGAHPRRDGDGDGLPCLAAEPALFPAEGTRDAPRVTCRVEPCAARVRHLDSQPVALIVTRLSRVFRLVK